MITDFDDKTLLEICGWRRWKEGKNQPQVFEELKVSETVVSGLLKQGRKKTRTVVKMDGEGLTPSCTCEEFRKSSLFCSCAVALLLQARESQKDVIVVKNEDEISYSRMIKMELLQPLSKVIKAGVATFKVEIYESEDGNEKALKPLLSALNIPLENGTHFAQLPLDNLRELLQFNAQTPMIKNLMGSSASARFPLEFELSGSFLTLRCPEAQSWQTARLGNETLLFSDSLSVYYLQRASENTSYIDALLGAGESTLNIGEYFTSITDLSQWFDLSVIDGDLQSRLEPQTPRFSIHIEGTVKEVRATVNASYGTEVLPLTSSQSYRYLNDENGKIHITAPHIEQEALALLLQAGFETDTQGFRLSGEGIILEFLAYTYPLLIEQGWEASMMGSFRALAHNIVNLSLRLQIDAYESSDEFASLQFSFETPEGQGMKSGDVQRLIQSGKQSFKLKSGKVALLSTREYDLISEALKDCNSRQSSGKYLIPVNDVPYLLNLGIKTKGEVHVNKSEIDCRYDDKDPLYRNLRTYQKEGVSWLITCLQLHGGALLADDMGLGKTVQSIAVMEALARSEKILIVCPASLISNWEAEIQKWSQSDLHVTIKSYQKYQREASKHHEHDYALCIIDEASMIKNSTTKIARALAQQPAQYKLALTGTPVENSAGDLWSIFQFLMPSYLGPQKEFTERFVKPLQTPGLTADLTSKRLRARLKPVTLRRTKQYVLSELPPKTYRTDTVIATSEQQAAFARIKEEYTALSKAKSANKIQILTSIMRLRQVANDPGLLSNNFIQYSPKTSRLIEILEQAKALNKKVLVFSQFATMLEVLKSQLTESGFNCSLLTGATRNRDAEIQSFRETNNVFLISLKAGGFGLNLTEASIVVHYDPWWNPAVENQATDRAYRMGQSEPVSVIKLITVNSIDEKILKLQQKKLNIYNTTIDDQTQNLDDIQAHDIDELIL